MKFFHDHIYINAVSIVLVVFLFMPSIVKLSHAISDHEHIECTAFGELHMHGVELDCDFEKFNLSSQSYPALIQVPKYIAPIQDREYGLHYNFLSNYQKLHFALRGPPIAS